MAPRAPRAIPYADAKPVFDVLRQDLLPAELRGKAPAELEALWPDWVSRRDAMIRARVEGGDEDSIIHLLLFGTTFTKAPRASERDLAALVARPAEGLQALRVRLDDFAAAVVAPGSNERLQFARRYEQFDLVIATNILLYYDVFEQSLAMANIARMLRPGGFLLTNNRVFELPDSPLSEVGFTDTTYLSLTGIGETGDRVIWYQKQ